MTKRGTATLPLHTGTAPPWLFERMERLGGAIAELIIEEFGRTEFLHRLADPHWFQALGCALGFDWHSSGLTTTTMGALKAALDPHEHGVVVAGGKGATSRNTPSEIESVSLDLPTGARSSLQESSRLSALVDNACVQDTYTLYHHTMVLTEDGDWCVVQQGMNDQWARRYHWVSDTVEDFVVEPQSAICSQASPASVLDLTASTSAETRAVSLDLVKDDPTHLKRYLKAPDQTSLTDFGGRTATDGPRDFPTPEPDLRLPDQHALTLSQLSEGSIDRLNRAYELQPESYEDLLTTDGVGPKSLRALALIADLVYDAEACREDPALYAYAHGGKDGTPEPVDRQRYDRSIEEIRAALQGAAADRQLKQTALQRLTELQTEDTDAG